MICSVLHSILLSETCSCVEVVVAWRLLWRGRKAKTSADLDCQSSAELVLPYALHHLMWLADPCFYLYIAHASPVNLLKFKIDNFMYQTCVIVINMSVYYLITVFVHNSVNMVVIINSLLHIDLTQCMTTVKILSKLNFK